MRRNGVRGLFVTCQNCVRYAKVNVVAWPDDVLVLSLGPRMRCSKCGKLGAMVRPDWTERLPANTHPAAECAAYGHLAPPGSPGRYCRYGKTTTAGNRVAQAKEAARTRRGVCVWVGGHVRAASRSECELPHCAGRDAGRQLREIQRLPAPPSPSWSAAARSEERRRLAVLDSVPYSFLAWGYARPRQPGGRDCATKSPAKPPVPPPPASLPRWAIHKPRIG